jgi:hypothetical protein
LSSGIPHVDWILSEIYNGIHLWATDLLDRKVWEQRPSAQVRRELQYNYNDSSKGFYRKGEMAVLTPDLLLRQIKC